MGTHRVFLDCSVVASLVEGVAARHGKTYTKGYIKHLASVVEENLESRMRDNLVIIPLHQYILHHHYCLIGPDYNPLDPMDMS